MERGFLSSQDMYPAQEDSELPVPASWGVTVPILPWTPTPGSTAVTTGEKFCGSLSRAVAPLVCQYLQALWVVVFD